MTVRLTLTAAGRAALADASHRATQAVQLRRLAIGTGTAPAGTDDSARTALRAQRAIVAVTGDTTVPARIAVRADYAPDAAYSVTEIGLFARVGAAGAEFLFGYWVAASTAAAAAAAVDGVALVVAGIVEITQSAADVDVTLSLTIRVGAPGQATETALGILEIATAAEARAGTDTERAITPATLEAVLAGGLSPVGSVCWHAATSPPAGWLVCDGRAVSRTTYRRLFGVIGTVHGYGDNSSTFNLPDLRRRGIMGTGGTIRPTSELRSNQVGGRGGHEEHLLTLAQMPGHSHLITVNEAAGHSHGAGTLRASNAGRHHHTVPMARDHPHEAGGNESYSPGGGGESTSTAPDHSHDVSGATGVGGGHTHTATISQTGGSVAMNIIQPTLILLPIIRH